MNKAPFLLCILDGFGYSAETKNNAIAMANTPFWDSLVQKYPLSYVDCSGSAVGLPSGQIGNSEVGHMHIGAGRIIPQALSMISNDLTDNASNAYHKLSKLFAKHKRVHLLGLVSDGGVHSHIDHFQKVAKLAKENELFVHAFLDGRDTPPKSAKEYLKTLDSNQIKVSSICGRYYAMDRDNNFDRIKVAYDNLFANTKFTASNAIEALESAYAREETDEFVQPTFCGDSNSSIRKDDLVIFLNFRADRARQLTEAFIDNNFSEFDTHTSFSKKFVTLTEYDSKFNTEVLFPKYIPQNTLGEVISQNNLKQLRIAETEKYAHVTYFFNGGDENVLPGEDRLMIPSPKVATYDLKPEMSAKEVSDEIVKHASKYDLIVCNFANADMVGHTGDLSATIRAIEALDNCLQTIYSTIKKLNGNILITADHGNAESLYDNEHQQPHTAHTNNLVPCLLTNEQYEVKLYKGKLADIAPSILNVMGLDIPNEMSGDILFTLKDE